jgi:hypothetical protein
MKSPAHLGRGVGAGGIGQGELFEPPTFSPTYPKPSTLAGEALALLLAGRTLTHPEFEERTNSWRLSEPIRALRHDFGWPVETIELPAPTAERPRRVIAEYKMPEWVLRIVGGAHER